MTYLPISLMPFLKMISASVARIGQVDLEKRQKIYKFTDRWTNGSNRQADGQMDRQMDKG
jgi:hypothetical protein